MKKEFTKEFVRENLDCYNNKSKIYLPVAESELNRLGDNISLKDILISSIRTEDKFWWLMGHTDITVDELKELALKSTEVAVRIYENETLDTKLRLLFENAKSGIDPSKELKEMIKGKEDLGSAANHAIRSVARGLAVLFTQGHKRPLTIKALQRLVIATRGNEQYVSWVNDILKTYY